MTTTGITKTRFFVDHFTVKKQYEENKKIILDKITGKENSKLKVNLRKWADVKEIINWFKILQDKSPDEKLDHILKHVESIKKHVDIFEISKQLKLVRELTNLEETKKELDTLIKRTNIVEVKVKLDTLINMSNIEEIKEKIESVRQEILGLQNNYDDKIDYDSGEWFVKTISDFGFDKNRFEKIIKLLLEDSQAAGLQAHLKLFEEEKIKIIFNRLFSVFAKIKNINDKISTDELNIFAEATQDPDLHNLLFRDDPEISKKLKETVLPYSTRKKLVDLIFQPYLGSRIFAHVFNNNNELAELLSEPRIKPKNLVFENDGIWLQKQFGLKRETAPIELSGNISDFTVDSCGTIFTLEEINDKAQVRRITAKDNYVILQDLMPSKKIETNDSNLFVLDDDGSSITIFDRHDPISEVKKFKKEDFGNDRIQDISTSRNGNLLVSTKNHHVYKIDLNLVDFVHLCEKTKDQKNPDTLSGNSLLTVGKNNDNIYVLFTEKNKVLVYDQNMEYLRRFTVSENTSGFAVSDGNNFTVLCGVDSGIKIQNYLFGDISEISTSNLATDKVYQNARGDLFVLTKATSADKTDFFMEIYGLSTQFVSNGQIFIGPFDSGVPDTEWHKIQANVKQQDKIKTTFSISVLASDKPVPEEEQWSEFEPNTLLPNPSDSLVDITVSNSTNLPRQMKGRFAWLRIRLSSDDEAQSPIFKDIRLYYPRDSYLRYLPKIYQENQYSKDLLERYLSLFEKFFDDIDEKIFSFHKLLDPISTDSDFLPWLATWVALNYDKRWPEENLRNLLNHSYLLYKLRGTSIGLRHMIMFYLDSNYKPKILATSKKNNATQNDSDSEKIIIFENFQLKSEIFEKHPDYFQIFGADPYSFTVLVNSSNVNTEKLAVIRTIIENEKPAHTNGDLCLLNPLFILNGHTYLEVNTTLTEPKLVLEKSAIGRSFLK